MKTESGGTRSEEEEEDDECLCGTIAGERIFGGKRSEFAWNVFIKTPNSNCTGALLDRFTVLTAAHCVENSEWQYDKLTMNPRDLELYIGTIDKTKPKITRHVSSIHIHDDWLELKLKTKNWWFPPDRKLTTSDIAILRLDNRVNYR